MSDYTPTTEQVRTEWIESAGQNQSQTNRLHSTAAFERWLAGVRAEARAEALHDAADDWSDLTIAMHGQSPADWLRERANQQHPTTKEN